MVATAQPKKMGPSTLNRRFYQALAVIGAPAMPLIYVVDAIVNGRQTKANERRISMLERAENSPEAIETRKNEKEMAALRDKKIEAAFVKLDEAIFFFNSTNDGISNHRPVHDGKLIAPNNLKF
ncbi:MAG: hypothetical protein PHS57_02980 [Alphaproteobacteria bacterium]|nr:hypothetical protein [Alphaproteobacteria bacterium]